MNAPAIHNTHWAYYCEIDPHAAEWLRRLISAGHIAPGYVDERSIVDIEPADFDGFTQCHFFAGVAVWSHTLRLAGWGDDQPVWTGSCPCQPLSAAGKGLGFDDERHLWPDWFWLIQQCRPKTIFGEQVASADGLRWLDLVSDDLEASDYACGAVDTCAAGHGAFHIRQRLYFAAQDQRLATDWMVDAKAVGWDQWPGFCHDRPWGWRAEPADAGAVDGLVDSIGPRPQRHGGHVDDGHQPGWIDAGSNRSVATAGSVERVANSKVGNGRLPARQDGGKVLELVRGSKIGGPRATDPRWPDADWLYCRDGKWRPVEPGSLPLAHGVAARMGRLRAYGNGLDARQAAGFITAYLDRRVLDAEPAPAGDLFEWGC